LLRALFCISVVAALLVAGTASAQGRYGGGDGREGRGPSQIHGQGRGGWAGGEWRHTWHGGRFGWWWWVDNDWYLYPEPVYPYPPPDPYGAQSPAMMPPPEPLPPPPHYWYHCDAPAGFYPYVSRCPGGWRPVPATPPADTGS
jgi:hypothetical protein